MKVLQVVHGYPPERLAGTEIHTKLLATALAKQGHEVYVIYPLYVPSSQSSNIVISSEGVDNGVRVYRIKIPVSRTWRLKNLLYYRYTYLNERIDSVIREFIVKLQPDVVHIQHLIHLSAPILQIISELGIPTVVTLHDYWFLCPRVIMLDIEAKPCKGPEPRKCRLCWCKYQADFIAEYYSRKLRAPERILNKLALHVLLHLNKEEEFRARIEYMLKLLNKADKIIAPSRFLRNIFIRHGIPKNKIIHLPNGYDKSRFKNFRKIRSYKSDGKIVFGYIGGITFHKGAHVLIEAFSQIRDPRAKLEIYGSYNPESKYFQRLYRKISYCKNIKLRGEFTDIKEPYSRIDVLVFPSICYENCPLVLLEAQIAKTPVIASNIGAIPEYVVRGTNGLLFRPNDVLDLSSMMELILDNPKMLDELSCFKLEPVDMGIYSLAVHDIYTSILK